MTYHPRRVLSCAIALIALSLSGCTAGSNPATPPASSTAGSNPATPPASGTKTEPVTSAQVKLAMGRATIVGGEPTAFAGVEWSGESKWFTIPGDEPEALGTDPAGCEGVGSQVATVFTVDLLPRGLTDAVTEGAFYQNAEDIRVLTYITDDADSAEKLLTSLGSQLNTCSAFTITEDGQPYSDDPFSFTITKAPDAVPHVDTGQSIAFRSTLKADVPKPVVTTLAAWSFSNSVVVGVLPAASPRGTDSEITTSDLKNYLTTFASELHAISER